MEKPRILLTRRWPAVAEAALKVDFDLVMNDNDKPSSPCELSNALGEATNKVGIAVTNKPDVLSECTADLAITLMLMLARRAKEGEREARSRSWHDWPPTHLVGAKMSGKTLGIIGFGRIGQEVAKRAHHEFGMSIIVYNRSPVPDEILNAVNAKVVTSIDELLPQADFVSLHCPGGQSNRRMIDQRRLNLMKPMAFLINTARGELVDEHALQQSLWFETIGGAGLHVYPGEPKVSAGLTACDNAIVLPYHQPLLRPQCLGFQ